MSEYDRCCDSCSLNYFACIASFYQNHEASVEFLRKHGVLPRLVKCPKCDHPCTFRAEQSIWRCRGSCLIPKTKKRRFCEYSVGDTAGSFLQGKHLPVWKVILFVNHWLSKHWDRSTITENLKVTRATCYEWESFCCKVTDFWFENQEMHTHNVERMLNDLKKQVKRPGEKNRYLYQCVARQLFMKTHDRTMVVHAFFVQAGLLYPPQGTHVRQPSPIFLIEDSSDEEELQK